MRRYCGVAAVFLVLTTVVWVGSAWTGDPPSPEPEACCPCFYVESTGYKTTFGHRWCFLEETLTGFEFDGESKSKTYRRLRCGTICIEPVTVECTVTRYVAERRVKTVWWGWKQYEVEYTVYVPYQELQLVKIPRLQGEWCGVDPCKYTTWKIRHENEISVVGGGTTVGGNLYGKIWIDGLPGCDGVYKLRGERQCNGQTDGGDGIDCIVDLCDTCDRIDGCATLDGYDGCPE